MAAVNKVVYAGETLIDLTNDTVTASSLRKGVTAHKADGTTITGTLDPESGDDEIDRILTSGLTDGWKYYLDDGNIISQTDSQGRTLTKTFSDDSTVCTIVLTDSSGEVLGSVVKKFQNDGSIITTVDSKGQRLVKEFTDDFKKMRSVLTDSSGKQLAELTKVFSDDGQSVESTVKYY